MPTLTREQTGAVHSDTVWFSFLIHTFMNTATTVLVDSSNITQLLRDNDITPTQQRVEIAQLILARHQHFSADELLNQLGHCNVSKATVYNTLGLFVEKGLVRPVIIDPNKVFYDSNIHEHHHFYNVDTGILTDIPCDKLALDYFPPLPEGTQAEGVDIIIRIRNRV